MGFGTFGEYVKGISSDLYWGAWELRELIGVVLLHEMGADE